MLDWSLLRFPTYGSGKVGKGVSRVISMKLSDLGIKARK